MTPKEIPTHQYKKKRYAHTIEIASQGRPTPIHTVTLSATKSSAHSRNLHGQTQQNIKKTLRKPLGIRGARPRSGRFLVVFGHFDGFP